MTMAVATQRMTYVDYLKSPEINARFDIIGVGDLVRSETLTDLALKVDAIFV
jgi:hypothetical protein